MAQHLVDLSFPDIKVGRSGDPTGQPYAATVLARRPAEHTISFQQMIVCEVLSHPVSPDKADPCCITCPEGEPKYYSIDKGGNCGEACIPDSNYPVLKMFEPGLLKVKVGPGSPYDQERTHLLALEALL